MARGVKHEILLKLIRLHLSGCKSDTDFIDHIALNVLRTPLLELRYVFVL